MLSTNFPERTNWLIATPVISFWKEAIGIRRFVRTTCWESLVTWLLTTSGWSPGPFIRASPLTCFCKRRCWTASLCAGVATWAQTKVGLKKHPKLTLKTKKRVLSPCLLIVLSPFNLCFLSEISILTQTQKRVSVPKTGDTGTRFNPGLC